VLAQELGLNQVRVSESTLIQKFGTESQNWNVVRIHVQVQGQFYWNEKLSIHQLFSIDQVQDGVMKLNLDWSFQDTMILGPYQYD